MTTVTQADIAKAVQTLGVSAGDIVLVHSSFKSMGQVEGGAEAVISGFLDVIGPEGTLVLPTFVQKDFANAYKTWHMDKDSDVGYLTNYFRKRAGSLRSDQATHSVAAAGKYAKYLTETHGHTHKRFGNMGDTPFSADSPWEKMYQMDAKIVLLGVTPASITFRHYAEYCYVEKCLKSIEDHADYDTMKEQLWRFGHRGVWPHVFNNGIYPMLEAQGKTSQGRCGDADVLCVSAKCFVDFVLDMLRCSDRRVLWRTEHWDTDAYIKWEEALREMQKSGQ